MSDTDFWAGDPVVVTTADGPATPPSAVFTRTGNIRVAHLDGSELPDEDSVFQAFLVAFEFPQYFGWNWDALNDCLRDLKWLPANAYVVVIDHAGDVLAADRERRRTLFRILRRAANHPRAARFKVLLICESAQVEAVSREVAAA